VADGRSDGIVSCLERALLWNAGLLAAPRSALRAAAVTGTCTPLPEVETLALNSPVESSWDYLSGSVLKARVDKLAQFHELLEKAVWEQEPVGRLRSPR
jgi:hypothetical protein